MEWPTQRYRGEVLEIGHDDAMALYEEVPTSERLYTLEDIVFMMGALGSLPENDQEWEDWIDGHVEHMAVGGFVIGRPIK